MEKELYATTQQQIMLLIPLIRDLPLQDFLNAIDHCETVAPLLDPTLYMRGAKSLDLVKKHARALREAQRIITEE